ncbi:Oidioi.mRNA.OKI2018_I69.chr1.g290.t1.cds [Oikopleura dioica]|uniref:protein-tyrosine-phosphatase n=1 Tax=Oikopleura dioica TaxID=34765 RepID=A0ABN7STN6_OIKDI|nr:Oidioi.mRNA.OKI2018_I69.chr1.g290.t1.cds [Oikopleura dioica]
MIQPAAQVDGRGTEEDSENDEDLFNFRSLFRHMHGEARRLYSGLSCDIARSERNLRLNRYSNVSPYDSTRIILSEVDGTDYINANLAHSSAEPQLTYILTQGPLRSTVDDFWRMAWEKNVTNIVMLNKLFENGRKKCEQYWPELVGLYMNCSAGPDITYKITLKDEKHDEHDRFVVRQFELERSDSSQNSTEMRTITQFHYIAWPDFGVPETTRDFGDFFHLLNKHDCFSSASRPSIVHCSAGIGRTGTLILVDSCLKLLSKQKCDKVEQADLIDMAYREVLYLRQFRAGLIQTADQLEFSISSIEVLYNEYLLTLNDQVENTPPPTTTEDASNGKPEELSGKEKIDFSSSSETTETSDEEPATSEATVETQDEIQGETSMTSPPCEAGDSPKRKPEQEKIMELRERVAMIKNKMREVDRQREEAKIRRPKLFIAIGVGIAVGIGAWYWFNGKEAPSVSDAIDESYVSVEVEL